MTNREQENEKQFNIESSGKFEHLKYRSESNLTGQKGISAHEVAEITENICRCFYNFIQDNKNYLDLLDSLIIESLTGVRSNIDKTKRINTLFNWFSNHQCLVNIEELRTFVFRLDSTLSRCSTQILRVLCKGNKSSMVNIWRLIIGMAIHDNLIEIDHD